MHRVHRGCARANRKADDKNPAGEKMRIPQHDIAMFVAVAATSIIGLNMSLMLNTIGFYQVCKLAQIPTMCVLELVFMGRSSRGGSSRPSSWCSWASGSRPSATSR